jgi:hypothetical protein
VAGGVRLGTARGQGHAAKGGTTGGCGPGAAWSRPSVAGRAHGQGGRGRDGRGRGRARPGGAQPGPSATGEGSAVRGAD